MRKSLPFKRTVAPLLLAVASVSASPEGSTESKFAELLRSAAGGVRAEQLAAMPDAVESYLSVVAGGTLLDAFGTEQPLTAEQRGLLESTAALLPSREVAGHVQRALQDDPPATWRRAALELLGLHASAGEVKLMIRLVDEKAEGRDQASLLTAFQEALIKLVRRDPAVFGELHGTGYIRSAVAVEMVRAVVGAKARAILEGRFHATTDDVKAVAHPVLRHRLVTTFQADSEGINTDHVVDKLLKSVPVELKERAKKLARG